MLETFFDLLSISFVIIIILISYFLQEMANVSHTAYLTSANRAIPD